ncbi:MAG: IS30 family transposase, partial [Trebonia sp.]
GVNNSEACRRVGIDRKTGNRWRYGRTVRNSAGERVHYAPVQITEPRPRSPRYLSEAERLEIADLLRAGLGVRAIARAVGRAASTISCELRRNVDGDGRYRPHRAEQLARAQAGKSRPRRITLDTVLGETVSGLLAKRWSPEQVAHELRERFAEQRDRWLCAESIYQAIYDARTLITRPARRRRRRRRLQGLQRRGRLTAMRMISERPVEAQDRQQAGHWEGDLIMGPGDRSAIGTLVERSTRFVILLGFADGVPTTAGCAPRSVKLSSSSPRGCVGR